MIILYTRIFWNDLSGNGITSTLVSAVNAPYTKAEWFLQIFDNAYLSGMFLFKLRSSLGANLAVSTKSTNSIANRVRTLFWIAATNFVFPGKKSSMAGQMTSQLSYLLLVAFNIAQVVVMYRTSSAITASYLMWTNIYVSIVGVVYATVWSHVTSSGPSTTHTPATFASPRYRSNISGPIAFAPTTTATITAPGGASSEFPTFDVEYRSHSHDDSDGSASWAQREQNDAIKPAELLGEEEKTQTKLEV
jgi:hypothetical protein